MSRPLVAGNWKLNCSRAANASLLAALRAGLRPDRACDVMVCPPFVYLSEIASALSGSGVLLGAQDAATEASGAFTGEVSATMLRDVGCSHVIIGHSERRALYGDTVAVVARKFEAVRAAGLQPILCVGETLQERQSGVTQQVVSRQLGAVLDAVPVQAFAASVVAYEPVWAIGTGRAATPELAQEVHAFIRRRVAVSHGDAVAAAQRILYGGSVKPDNIGSLMAQPDIDGALVGGASLEPQSFARIVRPEASE